MCCSFHNTNRSSRTAQQDIMWAKWTNNVHQNIPFAELFSMNDLETLIALIGVFIGPCISCLWGDADVPVQPTGRAEVSERTDQINRSVQQGQWGFPGYLTGYFLWLPSWCDAWHRIPNSQSYESLVRINVRKHLFFLVNDPGMGIRNIWTINLKQCSNIISRQAG